jgi:hypothetical protein
MAAQTCCPALMQVSTMPRRQRFGRGLDAQSALASGAHTSSQNSRSVRTGMDG